MGNKTKVSVIGLEGADMAMRVRKSHRCRCGRHIMHCFFDRRSLYIVV